MKNKLRDCSQAAIKYGDKLSKKATKVEGDDGGDSSDEAVEEGISTA